MAAASRPVRLRLPDTLAGDFTGLIIGTYGAALDFAEVHLFRQLSRQTVNKLVLADDVQLATSLSKLPPLRRVNRSYVASPVRSPRAHHPKFLLLVGPESGRLHVGSGNLSISGYAGPGECFTSYEWDANLPASAYPFAAIRELLELEISFGWLDSVTSERIRDLLAAAPWIPPAPASTSPVIHNLRVSLLEQLMDAIARRHVEEVIATAPFYDRRSQAIKDILQQAKPDRLRLLVQEGFTRLDNRSLTRVLETSGVDATIVEAAAMSPYPNVLLHSKFIMARLQDADVILQGSANLSDVALSRSGPDANVEIGNLLEAPSGQFDDLLRCLKLNDRPDGLASFTPDEDWGSDDTDKDEYVKSGPWNVCWVPPRLTGHIRSDVGEHLDVTVARRSVTVERDHWERDDDGGWRFLLEFDEKGAIRIDNARAIELLAQDGTSWFVYPYHLLSLHRLSATGHRADLLQEVGNLDLRDKELEELVAELDRVLVVDGRSLWRLAHQEDPEVGTDDDDAPRIDYRDLDWKKIGDLPQLRQYGLATQRSALAPTELGLLLHSLTSRFRAEVLARESPADMHEEDDVSELDDLENEQGTEDADLLDDMSPNDDQDDGLDPGRRRLSPHQRVRRIWRNFVRRFISGLSDEEFIEAVGSVVIVPSYIVFNHLCRRLRVVDLIDLDFLTDAQMDLWSFMWGADGGDGYLDRLPDDERRVARQLLSEHEDLAVTLAAIDDAWWHVWVDADDARPLRDVWRNFLQCQSWTPERGALLKAAAVAQNCEGDGDRLFDDLYDLAALTYESERDGEIALRLGVTPSKLEMKQSSIHRGGDLGIIEDCQYFEILDGGLTLEGAQKACAAWKRFEPDRRYFRFQASNAVAVLDLDYGDGFYFDKTRDSERPFEMEVEPSMPWEIRLEELLAAA